MRRRFFAVVLCAVLGIALVSCQRGPRAGGGGDAVVESLKASIARYSATVVEHNWPILLNDFYLPEFQALVVEAWPDDWRGGVWVPEQIFYEEIPDGLGRVYAGPLAFPRETLADSIAAMDIRVKRLTIDPSKLNTYDYEADVEALFRITTTVESSSREIRRRMRWVGTVTEEGLIDWRIKSPVE